MGTQVFGFREVPYGWNSFTLVESVNAHGGTDYAGMFEARYKQEYRVQVMHQPGSHTLQFTWAIDNQFGAPHLREGQITLSVPPINVIDAKAAFNDYIIDHPDEFKIDPEVYLKSWR
jgi:hypothetical protein